MISTIQARASDISFRKRSNADFKILKDHYGKQTKTRRNGVISGPHSSEEYENCSDFSTDSDKSLLMAK
jgi:hypothetical protein